MKRKSSKIWKRILSFALVLCMVWGLAKCEWPFYTIEAATSEGYTVMSGGDISFFLSNKTASNEVTLTYKVESVSSETIGQNGVIATKNPASSYPYAFGDGSMKFANTSNILFKTGYTYTITISLGSDNKVNYVGSYGNGVDTQQLTGKLTEDANLSAAGCQYFGLYIEQGVSVTLSDVACVDADGNDLGIMSNQASCVIETPPSNVTFENCEKYDVTTAGEISYFLGNKTASSKAVSMTYTVESVSSEAVGQNGLVATKNPGSSYPYAFGDGSMKFESGTNVLVQPGYTYTITMKLGADNKISYEGSCTKGTDTQTLTGKLTADANLSAAGCQYFGLYIEQGVSVTLSDVACVDADGNDLGLMSNQASCVIEVPQNNVTFENCEKYDVTSAGEISYFLGNKTASSKAVSMTYTVEAVSSEAVGQNGLVATKNPGSSYPYAFGDGSMKFESATNVLVKTGYTYTITMKLGSDNKIRYSGNYTNGTETNNLKGLLTADANLSAADCQYFGLYIEQGVSVTLSGVACVDADGNDLGLMSNQASCVIQAESEDSPGDELPPEEPQPNATFENCEKHKVTSAGESSYFLSNKIASGTTVSMTYTVETVSSETVGQNGLVATKNPGSSYPYAFGDGSMKFESATNVLVKPGYTYTITMQLDSDNKISYSGHCTNGTETQDLAGMLTADANLSAAGCQYFGLYIEQGISVTLSDVACVDENGKDLGLMSNQASCIIKLESDEIPVEQLTPEELGYKRVTLDDFEMAEGTYQAKYGIQAGMYKGKTLSGKYLDVNVKTEPTKFGPSGSFVSFGGNHFQGWLGLRVLRYPEAIVIGATNTWGKIMYTFAFDEFGASSECESYNLKLGVVLSKDDVIVDMWLNDYRVKRMKFAGAATEFGNYMGVYPCDTDITVTVPGKEADNRPEEKLDPNYTKITLGNFKIKDGTYSEGFVEGAYALSMHKTVLSVDIEFSEDIGEEFRYGGQSSGWYGLRFWTLGNDIYMEDVGGNTKQYRFNLITAGTKLVGEEINLKLSTEYVDSDKDGVKDDVKLGVWFNDKLYNNQYIYLKNYQKVLGKYIGIYSYSDLACLKIRSVKGIETGVDYSIFGFTRNWKTEMGIR